MMVDIPFVSIICPIYNEENYIRKFIDSLIYQDFPKERLEIFFIDGMSTDGTRLIVEEYTKQHSNVYLLDNPDQIVSPALNLGIKKSKGDVIIRVDGHCTYPKDYISLLVKYLYELKADNVGGMWNTLPAKKTSMCNAIAIASSHIFGVGNSLHKIGVKKVIQSDTVPFGCFRREIFDRIGLFDEELIKNQDDEFNARIIKNGGKVFLIPDIVIDYFARDSMSKMSKMYYLYGFYKPLVNKKIGMPATIRQFFPLLFICGVISGAILSCFSKTFFLFYLVNILLYILVGIMIGIHYSKNYKDLKLIYLLPFTFFVLHTSYGCGYFTGLCKIFVKSNFLLHIVCGGSSNAADLHTL